MTLLKRKKIKVLELESWMKNERARNEIIKRDFDNADSEIEPVFNREGYYKIGKSAWFELDGRAWMYKDKGMFEYDLNILNTRLLRETEVQALEKLIKEFPKGTAGIDTKTIQTVLSKDKEIKALREIPRTMKMMMLKAKAKAKV